MYAQPHKGQFLKTTKKINSRFEELCLALVVVFLCKCYHGNGTENG